MADDDKELRESIATLVSALNGMQADTRKLVGALQGFDTTTLEQSIGALAGEVAAARAGVVNVQQVQPARYTTGEVASSTSSVLLFAENRDRYGATVYNSSTAILYVKLGNNASSTSFNVALAALTGGIGGYYEVPYGYTGPVTGAWASANGSALTAEMVL